MKLKALLLTSALALATTGCSTLSSQPEPISASLPIPEPTPPPTRSFEGDTLYELLLAEFAGKRNRADVALGKYLKQAHETRDIQVAERATQIANYLRAHQATMDAAILWAELDPENPTPKELVITENIRFGRLDEALAQLEQLMALDLGTNYEFLLQATRESKPETRQQILAHLRQFSDDSNNAHLWYARGILAATDGQREQALQDLNHSLLLAPDYENAILAKTQTLMALGQEEEGARFLAEQAANFPQSKRLGIVNARQLMQADDFKGAEKQFLQLSRNFPQDGDLLLSLGLINWENNDPDDARKYFSKMLALPYRPDEANMYLARIALAENETATAEKHFQQVTDGNNFPLAQIQLALLYRDQGETQRALKQLDHAIEAAPAHRQRFILIKADILSDTGQPQAALDLVESVLQEEPENIDLLYSRAMIRGRLDDLEGMEQDLQTVLTLEPDNSSALNALGYTYADRNERLEQAQQLIERAYELSPEDPAIIDSMGWLQYRLGNLEKAVEYLRQAYSTYDDQEVAAHLGEVLWVSGEKDKAISVWRKALDKFPDSVLLREVIERFYPNLL